MIETPHWHGIRAPQQSLTQEELDRLLMVAKLEDARDFCVIDLMYELFLRVSEVLNLTVGQVTSDGQVKCVRMKGSQTNILPIRNPEVRALVLEECRTKAPWQKLFGKYSRRTLDWRIKRYGNIAGLDPIKMHAHALKHTACQHTMDETDGNIMAVKQLAGHSDIGSTLQYADITTEQALEIRERYENLKASAAAAGVRYDPHR
jgi:site-specific recombinase XerD